MKHLKMTYEEGKQIASAFTPKQVWIARVGLASFLIVAIILWWVL